MYSKACVLRPFGRLSSKPKQEKTWNANIQQIAKVSRLFTDASGGCLAVGLNKGGCKR
jgi:hypothetical protein